MLGSGLRAASLSAQLGLRSIETGPDRPGRLHSPLPSRCWMLHPARSTRTAASSPGLPTRPPC